MVNYMSWSVDKLFALLWDLDETIKARLEDCAQHQGTMMESVVMARWRRVERERYQVVVALEAAGEDV